MLAHWREPDAQKLQLPLLALGDWHTQQARWTAKTGPIYALGESAKYIPFEVLASCACAPAQLAGRRTRSWVTRW